VLVVCTANMCRSPLAERVIAVAFANAADSARIEHHLVEVRSAGTYAEPGDPMCDQSAEMVRLAPQEHRAQVLEPAMLAQADLVLAADRGHRGACARMLPACRPHLFTIRQAAALAQAVAGGLEVGRLPEGAPPIPDDLDARLRWLVDEMDAARGLLAGADEGTEDIRDGHGEPGPAHRAALVATDEASGSLAAAMLAVLRVT
jgi:protein-tyrosine phosphatase